MARTFTYTTEVFDEYTDFPQTGDVDTIYIDASKNKAYRYDQSYYPISSEGVDIWGAIGSLSKGSGGGGGGGGGGGASWGSINGTLSNQTDLNTALSAKQNSLTLTTSGTSGAATLVDSTLNIPQYSGGASGIHTIVPFNNFISTMATSASMSSSNLSSLILTINNIVFYPYKPQISFTASQLYINVVTLGIGTLGRICIYQDTNGVPSTLLYQSADLDCSTIGIKTATTLFDFTAGQTYWLSFQINSTACTVSGIPVASSVPISVISTTHYNHLRRTVTFGTSAPSTANPTQASSLPIPFIGIRI